jgi:hypothetical protein
MLTIYSLGEVTVQTHRFTDSTMLLSVVERTIIHKTYKCYRVQVLSILCVYFRQYLEYL